MRHLESTSENCKFLMMSMNLRCRKTACFYQYFNIIISLDNINSSVKATEKHQNQIAVVIPDDDNIDEWKMNFEWHF